jgi:hypothetical protein
MNYATAQFICCSKLYGAVVMSEENSQEKQDVPHPAHSEMSEEEIDRNLEESFPSSDPPSWTLGTNHKDESASKSETGEASKNNENK